MAITRPRVSAATTASKPTRSGSAGRAAGLGTSSPITVKGQRATAAQRAVIDACLAEARLLGASRRVMVAVVMAITQESDATSPSHGDAAGPDSRGPFQQRAPWGPTATRMDPAGATNLFLTADKGYGVQGWKVVHGSLSVATGSLSRAINAIQHSAYPDAYAQWQPEAERTVATWLGSSDASTGAGGDSRYEFTRGERGGQRESSWDASGRLAEEVAWRRWAAGNVLYFVSDDELRQAAPSITIHGDEAWLLAAPQWDWATARAIAETTLSVLSDRWSVMPGAVVVLATGGPLDGRWLVKSISGNRLDSPVCTVALMRPVMSKLEPAASSDSSTSLATVGAAGDIVGACKAISDQGRAYLYGGGHGPSLSAIGPHDPLDCSSSTSLALSEAGMFPGSHAITSGEFAGWGRAGRGRVFSVAYSSTHVWILFEAGAPYARFDTSPWGDGASGPRVRTKPRTDLSRFSFRHWPEQ